MEMQRAWNQYGKAMHAKGMQKGKGLQEPPDEPLSTVPTFDGHDAECVICTEPSKEETTYTELHAATFSTANAMTVSLHRTDAVVETWDAQFAEDQQLR